MILVGISGKIGSGKDVIASYLAREHGFVRVAWADALKDEVRSRLRQTVRRITITDEVTGALASIPDELRWHTDRDQDEAWWDARLFYALWINRSPIVRSLLQEWGTDLRRADQPGYWLDAWERRVRKLYGDLDSPGLRVVVPDTRFPDEAQRILTLGGRLIRVNRPGHESPAAGHESETALDGWTRWDAVLENAGTISDLEAQTAECWRQWSLAPRLRHLATLTVHGDATPEERRRLADLLSAKACELLKGEPIGAEVKFSA